MADASSVPSVPTDPTIDEYVYEPLPSNTFIRLLHMEIREGSGSICRLEGFSIESVPTFRAVSYTWGPAYYDIETTDGDLESSPDFCQHMICDDKRINITQNLYDALTHFVALGVSGWFWIDALCINQADFEERTSQVLLMGKIYSSAFEVLVWLGLPRVGLEDLVWATTVFNPKLNDLIKSDESSIVYGNIDHYKFVDAMGVVDPIPRFIQVAEFYASCRWWRRAWVVQEIILCRRRRLFCGTTELDWEAITNLALNLRRFGFHPQIEGHLLGKYSGRRILWFDELVQWSRLQSLSALFYDDNGVSNANDEMAFRWFGELTLLLRGFKCLNPLDKIYSTLGIANLAFSSTSIEEYIRPDYHASVADVFSAAAMHLQNHISSLDILAPTVRQGENALMEALPSWVPDYTTAMQCLPFVVLGPGLGAEMCFDAALCDTIPGFKEVSPQVLTCSGVKFSVVKDQFEEKRYRIYDRESGLNLSLFNIMEFCLAIPPRTQGHRRLETIWRTLIADTTEGGQYGAPNLYEKRFLSLLIMSYVEVMVSHRSKVGNSFEKEISEFASVLEQYELSEDTDLHMSAEDLRRLFEVLQDLSKHQLSGDTDSWQSVKRIYDDMTNTGLPFDRSMCRASFNRTLFYTEEGYLGLGFQTVLPGDEIWLLCEAHTPYILRPAKEPGTYTMQGDCYLHGFMRGEMLDDKYELRDKIGPIHIV